MYISNIKTFSPVSNINFSAKKYNKNYYSDTNYGRYNDGTTYRYRSSKETKINPQLTRRAVSVLAALALAGGSCVCGYCVANKNDEQKYTEGFIAGRNSVIAEMEQSKVFIEPTPEPEYLQTTVVPTATPYVETTPEKEEIPQKVQELAGNLLREIDLSEEPYLFEQNSKLPIYFSEAGIDKETLAKAQRNFARIFKSGEYIIISPKQNTTMGELKRVMGVADEVIGIEPENELRTRKHIEGSNGNLDNAIIEANDAIKIDYYDDEKGHKVGSYTIHKSNRSRREIAQAILEWANK